MSGSFGSSACGVLVLGLACAPGPGDAEPRRARWTVRTSEPERALRWNATASERLGFALGPSGAPGAPPLGAPPPAPAGWVARAPEPMARASFDVPGGARCSWTELPGAAGGLRANVDRWRRQLGLGPTEATELEALPTAALGSLEARLVELEGTERSLIGLIAIDARRSHFLKLQGPAAALADERGAFLALARSLETGAPASGGGRDEAGSVVVGDLVCVPPASWTRGGERPMRLATWTGPGFECSLTILDGDGGGLEANVGRWYEQLGHARPSPDEVAELDTVTLLGATAPLVAIDGAYRGMLGETLDDARLLGAIHIGSTRSVFVKLIGERAAVHAERAAFEEFCRSLEGAR